MCPELQDTRVPERIGLFGGSFDPVHRGHTQMAQAARSQAALDEVWFIPAAYSPLKANAPVASDKDRLAMLRAATTGKPGLRIWEGELQMPPPSYSLRTVEAIQSQRPSSELYWLLGADQFSQLERWHNVEELARKVRFLVCVRPGSVLHPPAVPGLRWQTVENEPVDIASSAIRNRIETGKPVDFHLDPDVIKVIEEKELYRQRL